MYRKQVRRRRAVLVLLVIVSLILLSTHFSEGSDGPLHSVERGFAAVLAPVEEGADRALKPGRDLVDWFDETFKARGENDDLNAEVQDLRGRLAAAESATKENDQLRKLLKLGPGGGIAGYERGHRARHRALADGLVLDRDGRPRLELRRRASTTR